MDVGLSFFRLTGLIRLRSSMLLLLLLLLLLLQGSKSATDAQLRLLFESTSMGVS
jgi:hypothetical protein